MSSGRRATGNPEGALGAYEAAPAIMFAFEGDEMVLASANEAARQAFGDRCQYGRSVREMTPDLDRRTRDLMDEMVGAAVATGQPVTRPGHHVRMWEEDSDPVEVVWDLTVSPWFRDDGSVRGVLAHGVDVTGRGSASQRQHELVMRDVLAMQDALMPSWLPVLPGVEVAGRYLLAHREVEAGGDWYDALGLPDGRVALVVGDVPGHGLAAAAAMGQLRAVLEERLTSGAGLVASLEALDLFARAVPEASAATVCVVLLDPRSGRLEYCTAGHPPPLLIRPTGRQARFLPHSGAAPLATTGVISVARAEIVCGDLVMLYSDGLLARPGRTPGASSVELAQVATEAATTIGASPFSGPADRVCERSLETMTHSAGYDDDITVLVAEMVDPAGPLHLELRADDAAVPEVLDALATWLEGMRVRDLDHLVVQHAVDELVSNVVDHAYPSGGGRITVDAGLLDTGELEVRLADSGAWAQPRRRSDRGRGLAMVRGMVDRLVFEGADGGGTVATIRHRLSRPAHLMTGAQTAHGTRVTLPGEPCTMSVSGECLELGGSLDRLGVEQLQDTLLELTHLDRVVLDLSRVSRLPSSAVQALHRARVEATERGQELVVLAPPGTPAQHVLELVRLPYAASPPA